MTSKVTSNMRLKEIQKLSLESMNILNDEDLSELYYYIGEYFEDNEIGIEIDHSKFRGYPKEERIQIVHHLLNKNIPGWFSTVARSIWRVFIFELIDLPSSIYNIRTIIKNYIYSFFRNKTADEIKNEIKSKYGSKQLNWMKIFALAFQVLVTSSSNARNSMALVVPGSTVLMIVATFLMTLISNPFTFLIIQKTLTRKTDLIGKVESIYQRAWERMKKEEGETKKEEAKEEEKQKVRERVVSYKNHHRVNRLKTQRHMKSMAKYSRFRH
jgi:hypothetical protein